MSRAARLGLPLPAGDLARLRRRVRALAEQRPAVYRMLGPGGQVLYVGKAKRLRARLMTYFRASWPDDKAARILHAAADIQWDYVPSEFAACLAELRQIRRFRPHFNVVMNRTRRPVFVRVLGGAAPMLSVGGRVGPEHTHVFGPLPSLGRALAAVRALNDLLALRDCAPAMPIVFGGQGDLFDAPRQAACLRHELGTCTGPCAGFVEERAYRQRARAALAFLEGRALAPLDRVIAGMQAAAADCDFERAGWWREKFEALEWLLAATTRARTAIDLLTFVYRDPGAVGDDRAYVVRQGRVRATYPWPATPLEREAFRAAVRTELDQPLGPATTLPLDALDEVLLLMAWFRRRPDALRRTTPLADWA